MISRRQVDFKRNERTVVKLDSYKKVIKEFKWS